MEEGLRDVRPALVADGQAAVLRKPGQGALHAPAVAAQAGAALPPLRALRTLIPRLRRAIRQRGVSDALSAWTLSGRWRGRPRGRLRGGILAISAAQTLPSRRLAALRRRASGRPCRSTTTGRLLPALPPSVGCGPVCAPPLWPGQRRCPHSPGSKRSGPPRPSAPRASGAGAPPPPPAARRASAASRSRRCRSPCPGAASPKGCRS